MALEFRAATDADIAYIIDCTMKACRNSQRHSSMTNDDYSDYFKHHLIQLLANSYIKIACESSDPSYMLGFLVYAFDIRRHLVIHHIYVRRDFWRLKVASKLVNHVYPNASEQPIIVTQYTKLLPTFMSRFPNLSFNPYAVLKKKEAP